MSAINRLRNIFEAEATVYEAEAKPELDMSPIFCLITSIILLKIFHRPINSHA